MRAVWSIDFPKRPDSQASTWSHRAPGTRKYHRSVHKYSEEVHRSIYARARANSSIQSHIFTLASFSNTKVWLLRRDDARKYNSSPIEFTGTWTKRVALSLVDDINASHRKRSTMASGTFGVFNFCRMISTTILYWRGFSWIDLIGTIIDVYFTHAVASREKWYVWLRQGYESISSYFSVRFYSRMHCLQ